MATSSHEYQMNEIWKRAWRLRCCPPDTVRFATRKTKVLQAHLAICPWCQADRTCPSPLSEPPVFLVAKEKQTPQVGEIWTIRTSLAGWGEKARYYNAPAVLIVDRYSPASVLVVQLYDDLRLAGEGDISLAPQYTIFAESWNQYSLAAADLACCLGQVQESVLKTIAAACTQSSASFSTGSLLWFFRNLEIETGFYFARQSIASLLQRQETGAEGILSEHHSAAVQLEYDNAAEIAAELQKLGLIIGKMPDANTALLDAFLSVRIPDDRLPLAAADENIRVDAIVLSSQAGKITGWEICPLLIDDQQLDTDILRVNGRFAESVDGCRLLSCWWKSDSENTLNATRSGIRDGVFYADFPADSRQSAILPGHMMVFLLREG